MVRRDPVPPFDSFRYGNRRTLHRGSIWASPNILACDRAVPVRTWNFVHGLFTEATLSF